MKRDSMADAAIDLTINKLVPMFVEMGLTRERMIELFDQVCLIAEGKAVDGQVSAAAIKLFEVIRSGAKGPTSKVAEFVGLIADTLREIDWVVVEPPPGETGGKHDRPNRR